MNKVLHIISCLQPQAIDLKEVQIRPGRIHTRKDTVKYDLAKFATSKDIHIKDVLKRLLGIDRYKRYWQAISSKHS
ncbi:hypothetical protein [Bacteroides fluxus]|uniref:hypothetical protein n=1 Tax=Bacteroides fluxus TaxID=626930 RepID=UPI00235462AC|nr:hypothetical protein [Bacteroides fluxus]